MKEFIDKLISRLEEAKSEVNGLGDIVWNNAVEMCVDEVNQLAEEYKSSISITDYDLIIKFIEYEIERTSSFAEHDTQINIMNYVQQLQEQNNNGWIPCSERLPEEPFGCLVTIMDCEPMTQTDFENILPYHVGYDGETWNDADGEIIPFEVIAWQPLPAPYQPKGE